MADLRSLILFCNDPDDAARLLRAAETGDVDAQYAAGLVYAEGRGVAQDEARSFYWLSRAIEQGDRDAQTLRRIVAMNMSDEQHEQAKAMLAEHKSGITRRLQQGGNRAGHTSYH